ncbi:MAG: C25 family cysteine peptidase, partial [Candidatus Eisenbacteria bacterium]|nr:C25 family cysteine peptidase [Candidatus Eisenbacteria bacterium]
MILHMMLALLAAGPTDAVHVVSSTPMGTEVRILSPEPSWESVTIRGHGYRSVRLDGALPLGRAGEPDLPVYRFAVAIPTGTKPSVTVTASKRASYRDVSIPPAPREAVLPRGRGYGFESLTIPVEAVGVSEPYPAARARIVRTGRIRSLDVAYVEVSPFQYYPSQRLLCLDRDLVVTIATPSGDPVSVRQEVSQDFIDPVLSRLLENWEQARSWRQGPPSQLVREIRRWDPPSPAMKLMVDRPAFYSVTGADLQSAGMPIGSIIPSTLRLLVQGSELPLNVVGELDGRLDPQDRVEFLGEPVYREDQGNRLLPIGGKFTETNAYWLTWGGEPGLRMETRTVQAQGSGVRPTHFREQAHLERDLNPFIPNEVAISGDRYGTEWFWGPPQTPADGRVYYSFTLRGLADVSNAVHLRADLRGYTHPDLMQNPHHHAIVYLNDVQLTHLLWYANDEAFYDSRLDPYYDPAMWPNNGVLGDGENRFAVEISGDTDYEWMDGAYTDWFEVDYWRAYEAWNDSLAFWSPQHQGAGTYLYTVAGFSDSGQILVDLTHRQILQGYQETNLGAIGNWAVKFRDSTTDSTRYLSLAANRRAPVQGIEEESSSDLHGSGGADLVIISHPELLEQASRLAVDRTFGDTPVSAMVVDAHDIYDEYAYGVFDPRAIRDFLEDAYVHWPVPPSFVLLFGDASWDYKLNSPTSDPAHRNFVPSWNNPALDDYFANVDDMGGADSLLPDLYLARIPVENPDTARVVVDKLLGYAGGNWDPGSWRENVLLIAGGYMD